MPHSFIVERHGRRGLLRRAKETSGKGRELNTDSKLGIDDQRTLYTLVKVLVKPPLIQLA